jgi:hypothetical protein
MRCTTICDKVCQRLATGQWFSPGTPVSSTNKTDHDDITEILLKVALNTIKQTKTNIQLALFLLLIVCLSSDLGLSFSYISVDMTVLPN